jgi:predicted  nucleic acid-binding Zn-ribbon protein
MSTRVLCPLAESRSLVAALTAVLLLFTISYASAQTNWRFVPQAAIPMGTSPTGLLVTDLNGDGRQDLAVANPDSDTITLRLGQAGGGFGAQRIFSVGDRPGPIAAGDIDSDGLADLVIGLQDPAAEAASGVPANYLLSVLRGTGDANLFLRLPDRLILGNLGETSLIRQLALADYTGDGLLDALIGAETTDLPFLPRAWQFVVVSTGSGIASTSLTETVNSVSGTSLGGSPAIGVLDPGHGEAVMVMGGVGKSLQFRSRTEPVPPSFEYPEGDLTGLVAADFNGDGLFDVAASHSSDTSGTGGISLLYSAGDETGLRRLRWVAEGDYVALKGAEMTGDGIPDIVALAPTGTVAILQGSPIGFQSSAVDVGAPATSFGVTDVNGDGMTDLAVTTDSGVIVLLQRAPISPALVDDLEAQVSDLTAERDDLADANVILQGQLDAANDSIEHLTTERNNLESANATLQGRLNTANHSIDALTIERNDLASANATLQGLLDTANDAIGALTTERDDLAAAKAMLQGLLNTANSTIATQESTINGLQTSVASLTTERNNLAAANATLQSQLSTANGAIAAQEATIGNLQTQLSAANQAIATLTAQLANATADFSTQILALQQALQAALADPGFVIPGSTPQAQIQNLVAAINGLNPGQKLALYKNLGGRKR